MSLSSLSNTSAAVVLVQSIERTPTAPTPAAPGLDDSAIERSPQAALGLGQANEDGDQAELTSATAEGEQGADGEELSPEEEEQVRELRQRDQEVRAHEQAHVAAAGGLVRGGIYYDYQEGPDGRRYAVGGHVSIDTSEGRTPEETVQKARQIRRAALAPAEPSNADRAIAAKAAQMEARASVELAEEQREEQTERIDQSRALGDESMESGSELGAQKRESTAPAGVTGAPEIGNLIDLIG